MKILFLAGFAPIAADPEASRQLYVETLGLPLAGDDGYLSSDVIDGVKHFGVWPLAAAAEACFGTAEWPADVPVPQATVEFDVDDVIAAARELSQRGYRLLHDTRTEPWGQTVARMLSPEGLVVGLTHTPWLRGEASAGGGDAGDDG